MNGISPLTGQLLLARIDAEGLAYGLVAIALIVAVGAFLSLSTRQTPRTAAF